MSFYRHFRLALRLIARDFPIKQQLAYYATQFQTTELNGVFYHTPTTARGQELARANWHRIYVCVEGLPIYYALDGSV